MEDVYFIYTLVGLNYIKPVIHNFPLIPNNTNIVIITNTPHLICEKPTNFNLIVVDLETLRDDFSKEYETIIYNPNEIEYMSELIEKYKNGYKFPMGIMRYGMKWAIKNNVRKFLLIDCGVKFGFNDPLRVINILNNVTSNKNIIFGNPFYYPDSDESYVRILQDNFKDILEKYNINVEKLPYTYPTQWNKYSTGHVRFDGWMLGFWFTEIDKLELYFNLWNDITKKYFMSDISKIENSTWIESFEWISVILTTIFSKLYDTILYGHNDIINHYTQPENDFFAADMKFNDKTYINTSTREEFIKINRSRLITHYGQSVEGIKKIVWGFI